MVYAGVAVLVHSDLPMSRRRGAWTTTVKLELVGFERESIGVSHPCDFNSLLFLCLLLMGGNVFIVPGKELSTDIASSLDCQTGNDVTGLIRVKQSLGGMQFDKLGVLSRDHTRGTYNAK